MIKNTAPLFQKPIFNYLLMLAVLASLLFSILSFSNTYQLKKFVIPNPLNIKEFIGKLTAHDEMKNYKGINPLNIIQITNSNIGNLQSQIKNIDVSFIGDFIIQYQDRLVVYNYLNDTIKGTVNVQPPLPADFFTKLNKHFEMKDLQNEQPIGGGKIDTQALATLKQQSPDVYKSAKVGDYLLQYSNKLIIYDYDNDKIVNSVSIKAQSQ